MKLNDSERFLLKWLGESDMSQYGECHGAALDSLVEKGLAELMGNETGTQAPFIAKGRSVMYCAVRLTDAGRDMLVHDDVGDESHHSHINGGDL